MSGLRFLGLAGVVASTITLAASCSDETADVAPRLNAETTEPVTDEDFPSLFLEIQLGAHDPGAFLKFQTLITRRSEQLVQECMVGAGFSYQPRPAEAFVAPAAGSELSPSEYVKRFGFGMSMDTNPPTFEYDDPNIATYEALSPAAQVEYTRSENTCRSETDQRLQGALQLSEDSQRLVDDLKSRIQTAPDLLEAGAGYQNCMFDQGFAAENPDAARAQVLERIREEQRAERAAPYTQVQEFEMRIAAADYECGSAYRSTYETVRGQLEVEFLNQQGASLPSLDAAS